MPKVTEAIRNFLSARVDAGGHNDPKLIDRFLTANGSQDKNSGGAKVMETQINVAAGKGWRVDGKRNTFTNGLDEWWNIRIPKNANSIPEFRDYNLTFPLDEHADAIGSTGWDFAEKRSRWVGFDFDAITGHAKGVGVEDEELSRVKEMACKLPYVEVRKSTSGKGLHLYVLFDGEGIPTANHTEHAALARAVLGMMSSETGFDFASCIDACGGNMWIWSRKMTVANEGLKLIKDTVLMLGVKDLPANWKDHVQVVTRQRAKVKLDGLDDSDVDPFEALASSRRIVPLDTKHKAVIDEIRALGYTVNWVSDHHLLQTHTKAFADLIQDASIKQRLGLKGFFETKSEGKDKATPNCFAFPLDNGAWRVYLFTPGRPEATTWEQDGQGWTTAYFNRPPTLKIASRANGGIEDADKGGFIFDHAEDAIKAAGALGEQITVPDNFTLQDRPARLKKSKDGRLAMQIDKKDDDDGAKLKKDGWLPKKGFWSKVFETRVDQKSAADANAIIHDNVVRALVTPNGDDAGWFHKGQEGGWFRHSTEKVKLKLCSRGFDAMDIINMLGRAIDRVWTLVNLPFREEYPGSRQWNMNAVQFRYKPAELSDDEAPHHPHWDMILKHCGRDLDEAVQSLEWCRKANIRSGADYLLAWAACMFRDPFASLPYLFFYSPTQRNGKSTFHEALGSLMIGGVASADGAFNSGSGFNGEMANAVLVYIEETDFSGSKKSTVYNRLKQWVTSSIVEIHHKGKTPYSQHNTWHFVHTANTRDACPVFPGDTRITMIFVQELENEIPREVLRERLAKEAPHFMRTLMDFPLPPNIERLRIPAITTANKIAAEDLNKSPVEAFIDEECYPVDGEYIEFGGGESESEQAARFYSRFQKWLAPEDRSSWPKQKVIKSLPSRFPYGKWTDNKRIIGNLSFEDVPPTQKKFITSTNGRVRRED